MKLAIISSIQHLDLSLKGDILYYLSHIDNPIYIKFFRQQKKYKISDNSIHEQKEIDYQTFILRTKTINANEIIIPDHMKETRLTINKYKDFMKKHYNEVKHMNIQTVIQGKYLDDIIDCYKYYVKDKRVNIIGVPFDLTPLKLSNEKYENQMLNRIVIINKISQLRNKKQVHLLGLNSPLELGILKKYDFIRSNDSKLSVRCALSNIKFKDYITKPNKILDLEVDKLNNEQIKIANGNIKYLKQIGGEKNEANKTEN